MTAPMARSSLKAGITTQILLVVLGLGIAACLLPIVWLQWTRQDVVPFLLCLVGAFGFYFSALLVLRRPEVTLPGVGIIAVAAVVHFAPYRGLPLWDSDPYRYHWDGLLVAHGVNPFRYAPEDPALAELRDEWWEFMAFRYVHTIYPPVTQALLGITYFVDPSPRRVFVLAIVMHWLCLWPLLGLLRARGIPDKWLTVYAWNPLLANEFAIGGHMDPVAVFFLLAALLALERRRVGAAGALMALSVMGKTSMFLAVPPVLRQGGWRAAASFAVAFVLLLLPVADAGLGNLLSGHLTYAKGWEHNSTIFAGLKWLMGGPAARAVSGLAVLTVCALVTWRVRDVLAAVPIALAAPLLIGPTFFPWYVSWVAPFFCLYPTVTGVVGTFLLLGSYLILLGPTPLLVWRIAGMSALYGTGLVESWVHWRRARSRGHLCRP